MPTPPHFSVQAERLDERIGVLAVDGDIDLVTAPRLAAALSPLTGAGASAIVIDLSGVRFIDSSGISVLLNAQRRLMRAGGRLVLACCDRAVLRPLELIRLDTTFEIEPSRERAIARLDEPPRFRGRSRSAGSGGPG